MTVGRKHGGDGDTYKGDGGKGNNPELWLDLNGLMNSPWSVEVFWNYAKNCVDGVVYTSLRTKNSGDGVNLFYGRYR